MANVDNTTLTSNDANRFDEITKNLKFEKAYFMSREPGVIIAQTAWGVPHEEIIALSAKYRDMTFNAVFSFESERYETEYHVQYNAVKFEVIDVEPGYLVPLKKDIRAQIPCYDALLDKATEVFKRVDIVVDDPEKGKYIDWCDSEVTVLVEHYGYKMRARKHRSIIDDIECFKGREDKEIKWDEVKNNEIPDIPF